MTIDEIDDAFSADKTALMEAIALLTDHEQPERATLPAHLPTDGIGEAATIDLLAPHVLGGAGRLGEATSFAHMDPPTPWITWVMSFWNASLNQNLLHPDLSWSARAIEARVVDWLAPVWGMNGGHMTPGSTLSNLTALWAARECRCINQVVASEGAHPSVAKAARILGLEHVAVPTDSSGRLNAARLPEDLSRSALVLTAGTTSAGAVDPLTIDAGAAWTHVDAAWAGPLMLSERFRHRLEGIERADSVAVSAHKWFFQPKESALILFRDTGTATEAISFGGAYLAAPNVGLLGSHGAAAVPLMATLLAWGTDGIAKRIDRCMALADELHAALAGCEQIELFGPNTTGVLLWRDRRTKNQKDNHDRLPIGSCSTTSIKGKVWLRHVAANPNVCIPRLLERISDATGLRLHIS